MTLQEMMKKHGGCSERLPEGKYASGMEIDFSELAEVLDEWKGVWDQLEPGMVDQRRQRKQRQLQQGLGRHAQTLEGMTFKLTPIEGHSVKSLRDGLLRDNPKRENMIKDLFRTDTWWLLIARTRGVDGSDHLDFCHANTREVVRLKVSADSPIIDGYVLAGPVAPRGKITIFSDKEEKVPAPAI